MSYNNDNNNDYNPRPTPPSPYELEKRIALLEQAHENLREEIRGVKDELSKINKNISKLVMIVLGAVVIGVLNVLSGGIIS